MRVAEIQNKMTTKRRVIIYAETFKAVTEYRVDLYLFKRRYEVLKSQTQFKNKDAAFHFANVLLGEF